MATKSIAPVLWENIQAFFLSIGNRADGKVDKLDIDTTSPQTYLAGRLSYDDFHKTLKADTGFQGVSIQVGQELQIRFKNVSGAPISNGTIINAAGADDLLEVVSGIPLNITSPQFSSAPIGIYTGEVDLLDGEVGVATRMGEVHGIDTDGLSVGGVLYAGDAFGGLSQTFPFYPNRVVIIGTVIAEDITEGTILVDIQVFDRGTGSKSYSFSQANVGADTFYAGGFYEVEPNAIVMAQGGTQLIGETNNPYEAHAFMVSGGNGLCPDGVVGLRVRGVSINTLTGAVSTNDTEDLTTDITAAALPIHTYKETLKKWLGEVQYEFFTVSGIPTTYSLSFNAGYSKYEDLNNLNFTVTGLEVVGTAGATDPNFQLQLLKHSDAGWQYAATGFVPGDGVIASLAEHTPYDNLTIGQPFAWKRPGLDTYINGKGPEGVLFKIVADKQNSVISMDLHITGVIEQLVF